MPATRYEPICELFMSSCGALAQEASKAFGGLPNSGVPCATCCRYKCLSLDGVEEQDDDDAHADDDRSSRNHIKCTIADPFRQQVLNALHPRADRYTYHSVQ